MLKCNTCEFYVDSDGECHRLPPQVTVVLMPRRHPLSNQVEMAPMPVGAFPSIGPDGFCGEHKPKHVSMM